jgi:predicted NAD/FAD-binding protein
MSHHRTIFLFSRQVELRDREIAQLRLELEEMKNIKLDEFVEFDNFSRSFDDHQLPPAATAISATAAGTPSKYPFLGSTYQLSHT